MFTGFQHAIAGGQGNLIASFLQSPNFQSGIQGWQIAKDGSAEFNNLTIRGTFRGNDFEINDNGIFLYNGPAGAGNLRFSIAPAAGTDRYGNAYVDGFNVYQNGQTLTLHINASAGAPAVEMPTGSVLEQNHASLYTWVPSPAASNAYVQTIWQGPGATQDGGKSIGLSIQSAYKDGSVPENFEIVHSTAGLLFYIYSTGIYHQVPVYGKNGVLGIGDNVNQKSNISGSLPINQAKTSPSGSITGASYVNLSNAWTIPANDCGNYTKYRITLSGDIQASATPQTLWFNISGVWGAAFTLTGNSVFPLELAAGGFSASSHYSLQVTAEIFVENAGTAATVWATVTAMIGAYGTSGTGGGVNPSGLAAAQNAYAAPRVAGATSTVNSNNATTFAIQARWGVAETDQSVGGYYETFERIGGGV